MVSSNVDPFVDRQNQLGCELVARANFRDAEAAFQKALRRNKAIPELHYNLSVALVGLDRVGEAVVALRRALKLRPDYVDALSNLGSLLSQSEKAHEGVQWLKKAVSLIPWAPSLAFNLGRALLSLKHHPRAVPWLRRALAAAPDYAEAHATLAGAYLAYSEAAPAMPELRKAIALRPGFPDAQSTYGYSQEFLGDRPSALVHLDRALAQDPAHVDAHFNRSLVWLAMGDLARGWPEYEWRWRSDQQKGTHRGFPQPLWQGQSIGDGKLLVWGEQGLGDELRKGLLLPELLDSGIPLVVECEPRLVGVFGRTMPDAEVYARTHPPHRRLLAKDIVAQIPLGSLPWRLRPKIDDFRRHVRPLTADAERRAHWRRYLDGLGPGPRIGIAWRTGHTNARSAKVHTSLSAWGPLLSVEGAAFVNLQYGMTDEEIDLARRRFGGRLQIVPDLDLFSDIEGTIALVSELDLVITTGSTQSSVACAGAPRIWYLARDIGWLGLGTGGFPWCPRVRTFLCPAAASWDRTFQDMAEALLDFVARWQPSERNLNE